MLTSRPPFSGDTPVAIAYKHVQEPAPLPRARWASPCPPPLEAIDVKLLAKDPADRYASAEDLRADLRNYLEGLPVAALRSAAAMAAGRGRRRRRRWPAPRRRRHPGRAVGRRAGGGHRRTPPTVPARPPATPRLRRARAEAAQHHASCGCCSALLLVLAAGLFFFGTQLEPVDARSRSTVPSVVNQPTSTTATSTLEGAGLQGRRADRAEQRRQARASSSPRAPTADTKADKGSTVVLIVSAGLGQAEVPGGGRARPRRRPRRCSRTTGSSSTRSQQNDPKIPVGKVISQNPAGGTKADKGSTVTIIVSSGPGHGGGARRRRPERRRPPRPTSPTPGSRSPRPEQASTSVAAGKVIGTNPRRRHAGRAGLDGHDHRVDRPAGHARRRSTTTSTAARRPPRRTANEGARRRRRSP